MVSTSAAEPIANSAHVSASCAKYGVNSGLTSGGTHAGLLGVLLWGLDVHGRRLLVLLLLVGLSPQTFLLFLLLYLPLDLFFVSLKLLCSSSFLLAPSRLPVGCACLRLPLHRLLSFRFPLHTTTCSCSGRSIDNCCAQERTSSEHIEGAACPGKRPCQPPHFYYPEG